LDKRGLDDFHNLPGIPDTMEDSVDKEIEKNIFFGKILRGINLNISFSAKELQKERYWVFSHRRITID
jgi:hypothetical protein